MFEALRVAAFGIFGYVIATIVWLGIPVTWNYIILLAKAIPDPWVFFALHMGCVAIACIVISLWRQHLNNVIPDAPAWVKWATSILALTLCVVVILIIWH